MGALSPNVLSARSQRGGRLPTNRHGLLSSPEPCSVPTASYCELDVAVLSSTAPGPYQSSRRGTIPCLGGDEKHSSAPSPPTILSVFTKSLIINCRPKPLAARRISCWAVLAPRGFPVWRLSIPVDTAMICQYAAQPRSFAPPRETTIARVPVLMASVSHSPTFCRILLQSLLSVRAEQGQLFLSRRV